MSKLLVSITHSKDDTDRATVGFVVAGASQAVQAAYVIQSMPDVSPTKWHLAHTS